MFADRFICEPSSTAQESTAGGLADALRVNHMHALYYVLTKSTFLVHDVVANGTRSSPEFSPQLLNISGCGLGMRIYVWENFSHR